MPFPQAIQLLYLSCLHIKYDDLHFDFEGFLIGQNLAGNGGK